MSLRTPRLDRTGDGLKATTATEAETQELGQRLARLLRPGTTVFLNGPLGAGKSVLARAMIRACTDDPDLDVPSPSYTLANVYTGRFGEIWHVDLYRVSDPDDLIEIGLTDAVQTAVLLVEWPERWPDPPETRLDIDIQIISDTERCVVMTPCGDLAIPDLTTTMTEQQAP